jgi:hypothetical protein
MRNDLVTSLFFIFSFLFWIRKSDCMEGKNRNLIRMLWSQPKKIILLETTWESGIICFLVPLKNIFILKNY